MTDNTLIRLEACLECGGEMLWTQNAWRAGDTAGAAYRCANGHVIDPALTRQCPSCGVHDTTRVGHVEWQATVPLSALRKGF
jgi:predicted RNA-binding Zn-ribbon protein involved in translation (DUF1610 family)